MKEFKPWHSTSENNCHLCNRNIIEEKRFSVTYRESSYIKIIGICCEPCAILLAFTED